MNLKRFSKKTGDKILSEATPAYEKSFPTTRFKRKCLRSIIVCAVTVLFLTASSALVIGAYTEKTATLKLTAVNEYGFKSVSSGDTVTLTATIENQTSLRKGIVGLTMEIKYDSDKLTYDNETITNLLNAGSDVPRFDVSAYESETTPGVINVLMFAQELDEGKLCAVKGGDLFSLNFTVKEGIHGNCTFKADECKFADYKGDESVDESGFELINVVSGTAYVKVVANGYVAGDANYDGELNIKDLIRAKKYAAGVISKDEISFESADIDGDGDITADDLAEIRRMLLSK